MQQQNSSTATQSTVWKSAHDNWKAIDLGTHMSKWDEAYSQVVCHKEHAVTERQRLVQVVRDFTSEAKGTDKIDRVKVEALLQHFKGTISTLLERSKFAEDAFIGVYQVVSALQDPSPILWSAHVELMEQQRVCYGLEQRLREVGREMELMHHQRREEKIAMDVTSSSNHTECEAREFQLRKALQDYEQRSHAMQADIARVEKALSTTQDALLQANQMIADRAVYSEGMTDSTVSISDEDLQSIIANLERTVATLRGQRHVDAMKIGDLETDLAKSQRKEELQSKLVESLRQEKESLRSTMGALEARISALQNQLSAAESLKVSSHNVLTEAHRNALLALQQLGWVSKTPEASQITVPEILAKQKSIVDAQTKTLQQRIDTLVANAAATKAPLFSSSSAIAGGMDSEDNVTWSLGAAGSTAVVNMSSNKKDLMDDDDDEPKSSSGEVIRLMEDDPTLVNALTKQRDSLKAKLQLSDHRCQRATAEVLSLQEKCRVAQEDNVALYTRVQYLEDIISTSGKQIPTWEGKNAAAVQKRYEAQFNEKFSPFADWTKKQKDARYQNLTLVDRIALFFSASLLSSKYIRAFLVLYALLLHLIVFIVLAVTTSRYTTLYTTRQMPLSKNSF